MLDTFGDRNPPSKYSIWGLVEETGNQGDFIERAYRRSSKNVRGNYPKCERPTNGVSKDTAPTFTGIRVVQKHFSTCCEKKRSFMRTDHRGPRNKRLTKWKERHTVDGFWQLFRKIRPFWATPGSRTRRGLTYQDTLVLKITIFGKLKIPTRYMKNTFNQRRLVFGAGCTGGA